MDELLPLLVAHLLNRAELTAALEAAIEGTLAFLPLEEPPSERGTHALEIDVPWWSTPVVVLAELAGKPSGGLFPLALRPLGDDGAADLEALLAAESEVDPQRVAVEIDVAPVSISMAVVGQVLGGKYEVGSLLGAGGMGNVFRARHIALDKAIAVKVLHPRYQHDPAFVASFHREARASSRLDHPNVVRVLDFGQEPDGRLYLTMELLAGSDLREVLNEQRRLPVARITDVMSQVCAALSASHAMDVVHRDIKPDNIRLVPSIDDEGKAFELVKVCDFGIAEILGSERAVSSTMTSGTPDYMSPEQAQGAALDARSDVYSCGIMLYELATGVVPFVDAKTPLAILRMQIGAEPRPPSALVPGLDRRLEAVILKALRKDPAERYQSARELRVSLRAIADTAPAQPRAKVRSVRIPEGEMARRADAIDIDDLLAGGDAWRGDAKPEQAWIEGEQYATALIKDPEAAAARLDAITDPAQLARELPGLDRAMAALAHRGESVALQTVVARLLALAQGAPPAEAASAGLAAKALHTLFAKPTLLLPIAQAALDALAAAREAARRVLAIAGGAGAVALCTARQSPTAGTEIGAGLRERFVAALREIGPAALPVIVDGLRQTGAHEVMLLEDLLRAVPDGATPRASEGAADPGEIVADLLRHATPSVRRAAVTALASLWGPRARLRLVKALDDTDEGVLMATIGALHRGGGVDGDVVARIEKILAEASPAGDELRIAAAGALVDTVGAARTQAIEVLSRAVAPPVAGFLSKLISAETVERPRVVVTLARVLLGLAGDSAARVIETRAARSSAELKRELLAL
ncbi:MAG: protein kinase, partial [Byssovorax sp.]